ncbi:MAG: OmpH family outer membrane protein [Parachlamydiaceae bacterium]
MNRKNFVTLFTSCALLFASSSFAAEATKIGTVNFKLCVEESKLGKQEQASFETMKKQMENVVEEKEKVLNDLATKLNDPDQLDLMSPEAETDLKRKFRALSQELSQLQNQYYQTLQQANIKIVQSLSDAVTKASEKVAKDLKLDLVINDETCFFASPALDISSKVVVEMNRSDDQAGTKPAEASAAK